MDDEEKAQHDWKPCSGLKDELLKCLKESACVIEVGLSSLIPSGYVSAYELYKHQYFCNHFRKGKPHDSVYKTTLLPIAIRFDMHTSSARGL